MYFVQALFCNPPVQSTNPRESGPVHRAYFSYEMSDPVEKYVKSFMDDWTSLCNLYELVSQFGEIYNGT